jgi:iron complex outermembrane receptor protein
MKRVLWVVCFALLSGGFAYAQYTLRAVVTDGDTDEILIGATAVVKGSLNGAMSDAEGVILLEHIPCGTHKIVFSYTGYKSYEQAFRFPMASDEPVRIALESHTEELEEVVVSSTRGTRTIQHIPTRVEYIGGEELEEKGNMRPGDIRMLLNESTGIQTQQTSATSANASIRIQGLDGRYTQILKDGFPLYSGAAGGLGLLQIPPLDLRQVEIIKGSSSTLYGGGAIAGMVNLITKTPTDERELSFHFSGTSALGLDLNAFYAERFGKAGLSLFASRNSNAAYDPAGNGFSAIPRFERYVANPHIFLYFNDKTRLDLGLNTTFENRLGGDIHYIKGEAGNRHSYFEDNRTERFSTQFTLEHKLSSRAKLSFRNSFNHFHRLISIPAYVFDGLQRASFSELHYVYTAPETEWVAGGNLWTDHFSGKGQTAALNEQRTTGGLFLQNTWQVSGRLSLESGLRGDYVSEYGAVLLPRLSALFRINDQLSSRIGGGLGYKTPTLFTEESERIHYKDLLPLNRLQHRLERSYGANADLNFRTALGEDIFLSINQLFFYTYLTHPLLLTPLDESYQYVNIDGHIDTKGAETNLKLSLADFALFIGYTYTDAGIAEKGGRRAHPLTSRHRLNNVLMYEQEDKWKIGLEAYYYGPQTLSDGSEGRSFWLCGAMIEKIWEHFSVYVNFENFTDTRQTKFGPIYSGEISRPVFGDIYAPLDGFVSSIGLKIRL